MSKHKEAMIAQDLDAPLTLNGVPLYPRPPEPQDIPDLIAGALGVSRGTAYDMMREALADQPAQPSCPECVFGACHCGQKAHPETDATRANNGVERGQKHPAQREIDWKDQYEKQKRRADMWVAKYEADIGPLEKAGPVAEQPAQQGVLARKWVLHGGFADVASFDAEGFPSFYWKESVAKFKAGELSTPCKGKNCGSLNGWLHSAECRAEHEAHYAVTKGNT